MKYIIAAAMLLFASAASAEVVSAGEHGFELRHSAILPLPPEEALRAFGRVERWWDAEHTYSGSASSLSMALQPGGCFCERLPNGGGIEHMRVAYVDPGKRLVLTGSLGPLLYLATAAVWDIRFTPVGTGSRVTFEYKAAGFANGGAAKLAPLVDRVLAAQVAGYVASSRPSAP